MERENRPTLVTFRVLVVMAWVGLILASLYLVVGVSMGSLDARMVNPWLGVSSWDSGLAIGVSRDSLSPEQWRTFCSSVGIWSLAGTLTVLLAVEQVRRIVCEPPGQSPFTAKNARRVWTAGMATIVGALAKAGRDFAFARFISKNVRIEGVEVAYTSDLGLSTVFIGIMVLAVAEVMRHGAKLQEDQDLTV